jgi:hypothetical protein
MVRSRRGWGTAEDAFLSARAPKDGRAKPGLTPNCERHTHKKTTTKDDPELEAIRQRRMAEMMAQQGGGGGGPVRARRDERRRRRRPKRSLAAQL